MSFFHPESMHRVSLFFRFDDAPLLSVILAKSGVFEACHAEGVDDSFPERQGVAYRRIFQHALSNWQKINHFLALTAEHSVPSKRTISKTELLNMDHRLAEMWKRCLQYREDKRHLDKQLETNRRLFKALTHFHQLDFNLSDLKDHFVHLDVRLGIIPSGHLNRLRQALSIEGYHLSNYLKEGEKIHIIVAGVRSNTDMIQPLLESAAFHPLAVPREFSEHPKVIYQHLQEQEHELQQKKQFLQTTFVQLQEELGPKIVAMTESLLLARSYALLSQYMCRKGQLMTLQGWVPERKKQHLQACIENGLIHPVVIKERSPRNDEYQQTPSYVKHPQWLTPFTALVNNYGVPGYREFEPTWLFTISYILMFGIMFGDVGHGLGIVCLGLVLRHKLPKFFSFFMAIGLSSTFFGFLYGSIFAFEHELPALWMSPMHDPMLMLVLALGWGVSFIILLNLLSIYNRYRQRDFSEAIWGSKGICGLWLYLSILFTLLLLAQSQFQTYHLGILLLPILAISIFKWQKGQSIKSYAERLLVIMIETYEIVINYLSHTISFLRVAAFTLNHSALAIALFTLADMTNGAGYGVVVILGNLFILVLEGAIVGIQVLRLEYYEGFSRYFKGNGFPFNPIQLSAKPLADIKK